MNQFDFINHHQNCGNGLYYKLNLSKINLDGNNPVLYLKCCNKKEKGCRIGFKIIKSENEFIMKKTKNIEHLTTCKQIFESDLPPSKAQKANI